MREISASNFGIVIAYLVPGFTTLWGFSYFSASLSAWIGQPAASQPTVAGFLYVTLGSLGMGMIVNAARWATLDKIHHLTGIRYPNWDFENLQKNLAGYETLVEFYFRYHEFFGNTLIAGSFTYLIWRWHHPAWIFAAMDVVMLGIGALLWAASRDTLRKYYIRSERLLSRRH